MLRTAPRRARQVGASRAPWIAELRRLKLISKQPIAAALHGSPVRREYALRFACPKVCEVTLRLLAIATIFGSSTAVAGEPVDYLTDVKPLLAAKCGACHGALVQEAGLRLDAGALILVGSDAGAVVTPGDVSSSLLMERVVAENAADRMPPEEEGAPLDAGQIAMLQAWIEAGAEFPSDEAVLADPADHWAYQPPAKPPVPQVDDAKWSHPIDAFVRREQREAGVHPVGTAAPETLLRRVYFDLIGLPPTPEQLDASLPTLIDDSDEAWRDAVDSLLASPHHGERWGRHWMDVWRYSDWDGYQQELRGSQRHIWRWRDWIVQSLNDDKGYDQMVVEMLAGDEVAPTDRSVLAATGFLGRNYHNSNRNIWLDATVEHTAKAFLGVTLNCARCHDHKFDPLPQQAYYEFRAIFEPHQVRTDRLPGEPDALIDGLSRAYDAEPEAPTYVYVRGDEKRPDEEHPVTAAVPTVLGGRLDVRPASLPVESYYPAVRRFVLEEELAEVQAELAEAQRRLAEALAVSESGAASDADEPCGVELCELRRNAARSRVRSVEARQAADCAKYSGAPSEVSLVALARAAATAERRLAVDLAKVARCEAEAALQAAQAASDAEDERQASIEEAREELAASEESLAKAEAELEVSADSYTPLGTEHPRASTGRRLALARWITSRQNPLAARVAVNHVWMRHFGSPLVENVFDFGLRSPRPRHADLLDWLAVELMENDWSLKHLHRLILTSRTWRLASSTPEATAEAASSARPRQSSDVARRRAAHRGGDRSRRRTRLSGRVGRRSRRPRGAV